MTELACPPATAQTVLWQPASNLDAEHYVLGSLILEPDRLVDVQEAGLESGHFTLRDHEIVYEAIQDLVAAGKDTGLAMLGPRLRTHPDLKHIDNKPAWLHEIAQVPWSTARAAEYARLVVDAHRNTELGRRLVAALQTLNAHAATGMAESLSAAEDEIVGLLADSAPSETRTFAEIAPEAARAVDTLQKADAYAKRLTTGWSGLDGLLGDLRPGSVTLIAARPSQGKSSLANGLIRHHSVALRRPALLVTLEVPGIDVLRNIACAEARVNGHALVGGQLGDADYQDFTTAMEQVRQAPAHLIDRAVTAKRVRAITSRLAKTHGLELVIVDYLQLLTPTERRQDNREREVARMSAELKQAAMESGVAMVVLSQLNRAVETRNGPPVLSDLRDSGSLEQDADAVVLLSTTDDVRMSPAGEVEKKRVEVAKNRNGPTGVTHLAFHKSWTRFDDLGGFDILDAAPKPDRKSRWRK